MHKYVAYSFLHFLLDKYVYNEGKTKKYTFKP